MRGSSTRVADRLAAIGSGVISGPVDATNHVRGDVGQPLHAFDLDKLAEGEDGRPALVVRGGTVDCGARRTEPRVVTLRFPRLARFLGMEVPLERTVALLTALGLRVNDAGAGRLECTIPTARVDLLSEVDLFEEVIRHV